MENDNQYRMRILKEENQRLLESIDILRAKTDRLEAENVAMEAENGAMKELIDRAAKGGHLTAKIVSGVFSWYGLELVKDKTVEEHDGN